MVGQMVMRIVRPCFKPSLPESQVAVGGAGGGTRDGLLWYKDTGRHACGDFSMAVVQANNLLEDGSQVEAGPLLAEGAHSSSSGPFGTFVGIYDGHGGPETAHFIADNLFQHLKKFATEQQTISEDAIRKSYAATEEGFLNLVRKQSLIKPQLALVGSCCLVGIINEGVLYVANAGDSRAVLGRVERPVRDIKAVQLSSEHNASIEAVREELRQLHPDDQRIVVLKRNVWRVKGLIQVSRTIGDAYLKSSEFNREPLLARFRLPEPFHKPILCPEPSIEAHRLCAEDQFVIFASDGLWEHLSNQEAVDIVNCSPRNVDHHRRYSNPLQDNPAYLVVKQYFVNPDDIVCQKIVVHKDGPRGNHFTTVLASPKVYFESDEVHACIFTCGGLCPGLNTVIKEIVCSLSDMYGVLSPRDLEFRFRILLKRVITKLCSGEGEGIRRLNGRVNGTTREGGGRRPEGCALFLACWQWPKMDSAAGLEVGINLNFQGSPTDEINPRHSPAPTPASSPRTQQAAPSFVHPPPRDPLEIRL